MSTPAQKPQPNLFSNVASIILAGGQGTRLFPLTETRCKPAVTFGGKYRLIDIPISNSLNSNIRRIYVLAQYFSAGLSQHIHNTYQPSHIDPGSIEILSPQETLEGKKWFKGTADAVRQNLSFLLQDPADYFLILSGDQLYTIDFAEMILFAKKTDADMVILTLPVEEKEAKRMGLMKIDSEFQIVDFVEKPKDPALLKKFALPSAFVDTHCSSNKEKSRYLASMGIYIFKRDALVSLLKEEGVDFGMDFIPMQIKRGKSAAFVYKGYWEDIGTVSSYYEANLALTRYPACNSLDIFDEERPVYTLPHHLPNPLIKETVVLNSIISQGSIVEAKEISHSIIGLRSHIHKGTIIRDSLVMGNHFYYPPATRRKNETFAIGENCLIERCIVDEYCSIGNNVELTNRKKIDKYDSNNGIYIRDGIIIVSTGVCIPDGFVL